MLKDKMISNLTPWAMTTISRLEAARNHLAGLPSEFQAHWQRLRLEKRLYGLTGSDSEQPDLPNLVYAIVKELPRSPKQPRSELPAGSDLVRSPIGGVGLLKHHHPDLAELLLLALCVLQDETGYFLVVSGSGEILDQKSHRSLMGRWRHEVVNGLLALIDGNDILEESQQALSCQEPYILFNKIRVGTVVPGVVLSFDEDEIQLGWPEHHPVDYLADYYRHRYPGWQGRYLAWRLLGCYQPH